ncbi:MAG TPA: saccharopine dehydrogenase NADP-binding domain-containing protein [Burkholderiaceae bacterium]|nr:saccharopine dehydrogenase NADP-binding domain-containing protein [Burkholderiaceae bacterium]
MKIILVGAGNIGRALVADLLDVEREATVLALDADPRALAALDALGLGRRVSTRQASADEPEALAGLVRGHDVVVNCTYGAKCLEILDAAIMAKVPYIDVHGTLLMEERFARDAAAKAAGVTALIGTGVSPGLTNMMAAWGARRFDGDVSIECEYSTFRPINPTEGLLETALRQFRNGVRAPVYRDCELSYVPPFSGAIRTRFPGVDDEVELVLTPHSEPQTIPRFVPNARDVTVRGAYQASVMALLRSLYDFGLMDPARRVTVDGRAVDFAPLLREALMGDGSPKPAGVRTNYVMRVRVTGASGVVEATLGHPPGWDPLPQGRMTSLQPSFAARLVARGEFSHPGVVGAELFTDAQVEACLAHLRARGLWVERVGP